MLFSIWVAFLSSTGSLYYIDHFPVDDNKCTIAYDRPSSVNINSGLKFCKSESFIALRVIY